MSIEELKHTCKTACFTREQLLDYNNIQCDCMKIYLSAKREAGDNREKNEIYIEWIENYSEQFRIMYIAQWIKHKEMIFQ